MAAVVSDYEQRPEHGALRRPVSRPDQRVLDSEGSSSEARHNHHVPCEVGERTECVLLETLSRDGFADLRKRERWLRSEVEGRFLRRLRGQQTSKYTGHIWRITP